MNTQPAWNRWDYTTGFWYFHPLAEWCRRTKIAYKPGKPVNSLTIAPGEFTLRPVSTNVTTWDFLGDGESLVITLPHRAHWWKRFWCRVFFGSKWKESSCAAPSADGR